ncbi:hypothetical protein [Streptomyces hirsutus]|uniref:hypothetical protein n=1 Tax=Streptomyces hirsutus TaxID=35620 RepID=UPI0036C4B34A
MPETEAAVVRPGTGTFAWETLQVDEPRPDELLVRIVGVGICHTDSPLATNTCTPPCPPCWITRARAWRRRSAPP